MKSRVLRMAGNFSLVDSLTWAFGIRRLGEGLLQKGGAFVRYER